jgi:hypothetical protein
MQVNKLNPNLIVRKTASVNYSASQWGLFTHTFSRTVIERVADLLNKRFNLSYNKGMTQTELVESMESLMSDFSIYGAADTEPRTALNQLIKKVY